MDISTAVHSVDDVMTCTEHKHGALGLTGQRERNNTIRDQITSSKRTERQVEAYQLVVYSDLLQPFLLIGFVN